MFGDAVLKAEGTTVGEGQPNMDPSKWLEIPLLEDEAIAMRDALSNAGVVPDAVEALDNMIKRWRSERGGKP